MTNLSHCNYININCNRIPQNSITNFLTGYEYKYSESNVKGVIPVKPVKLSFISLLYNIYLVCYIKHIGLIK